MFSHNLKYGTENRECLIVWVFCKEKGNKVDHNINFVF